MAKANGVQGVEGSADNAQAENNSVEGGAEQSTQESAAEAGADQNAAESGQTENTSTDETAAPNVQEGVVDAVEVVEVRVLTNFEVDAVRYKGDQVVSLPVDLVAHLKAQSLVDDHPDAVAYAKTLSVKEA